MIEVLIALVIVGIGMVGLLSLLTTSLKASSDIVEDSFAATLARSVYESVRESAHKRPFMVKNGAKYVKGFVFLHDGVKDLPTTQLNQSRPPMVPVTFDTNVPDVVTKIDELRKSDYAIFLPNQPTAATGGTTGGGGGSAVPGEDVFVYPRPTGADPENGQLNGTGPGDLPGKSNFLDTPQKGYAGEIVYYDVQRTYQLKARTPSEVATGTNMYNTPPEVADQYSFALLVRRSVMPALTDNADDGRTPIGWAANGDFLPGKFPPRMPDATFPLERRANDGLYQVEVWVYRNFEKEPASRHHYPVRGGRLVGLVALGP